MCLLSSTRLILLYVLTKITPFQLNVLPFQRCLSALKIVLQKEEHGEIPAKKPLSKQDATQAFSEVELVLEEEEEDEGDGGGDEKDESSECESEGSDEGEESEETGESDASESGRLTAD